MLIIHKPLTAGKFFAVLLLFTLCFNHAVLAQEQTRLCTAAKNQLSQAQVAALTANGIKALNFIFTASYIVDTTTLAYRNWIRDNGPVDVTMLENHRKKSERSFYLNEKYPGLRIELLSRDEMDAEIKKIMNPSEIK